MIVCINNSEIMDKKRVIYLTVGKSYNPLNLAIYWSQVGILVENDSGRLCYYHESRFENLDVVRHQKIENILC